LGLIFNARTIASGAASWYVTFYPKGKMEIMDKSKDIDEKAEVELVDSHKSARAQSVILLIGLLEVGLLLAFCIYRLNGLAADDSFIHRRIALNFLQTGRAYYNLDQRVMVTSSPLSTILLALVMAVVPNANSIPWIEFILILAGASAAYLLVKEGAPKEGWTAIALPALAFICVCVADLPAAILQMETPLAIALILAGCLSLLRKKPWGMSLIVLACFIRYECSLLLVMAIFWMTINRQWKKSSLFASGAVGLSGVAWLLWQYGTVIPNTVIAKSHLYSIGLRNYIGTFIESIVSAFVCLSLGLIWFWFARDRNRGHNPFGMILVGFGVILALAYIAHRTAIFPWYQALVLLPVSLGILLWTDRTKSWHQALGALLAIMVLLPFAGSDLSLLLSAFQKTPRVQDLAPAARVHEYKRIGAALYKVCPTGDLMTSEIGGLGWTFRGKILDGSGLASPEAIRYHPMRIPQERSDGTLGEIPAGYVRDRHPDLIVSYDINAESALPAAVSIGYIEFSYPPFLREDRAEVKSVFGATQMFVLVSPNGHCSPTAVDQAVRSALEE
jgi:hypothetical protein